MSARKFLFPVAAIALYAIAVLASVKSLIYIPRIPTMYALCGLFMGIMPALQQLTLGKPRVTKPHIPTLILGCIALVASVVGLFVIKSDQLTYDAPNVTSMGATFLIGLSLYNPGGRNTLKAGITAFSILLALTAVLLLLYENVSATFETVNVLGNADIYAITLMGILFGALLPMRRFLHRIPAAVLTSALLVVLITCLLKLTFPKVIRDSFSSFCWSIWHGGAAFNVSGVIGLYAGVTGMLIRQTFSRAKAA